MLTATGARRSRGLRGRLTRAAARGAPRPCSTAAAPMAATPRSRSRASPGSMRYAGATARRHPARQHQRPADRLCLLPRARVGGDVFSAAPAARRRPATTTTHGDPRARPRARPEARPRDQRLRARCRRTSTRSSFGDDLPVLRRRRRPPATRYEDWGAPQSFMMLDIAALQHIYGADFTANAGNTVYRWCPPRGGPWSTATLAIEPGGNRIFATIWDGGGTDTYDLSAYAHRPPRRPRPGRAPRPSPRRSAPTSAAGRTAASRAATSSTRCSTTATRAR